MSPYREKPLTQELNSLQREAKSRARRAADEALHDVIKHLKEHAAGGHKATFLRCSIPSNYENAFVLRYRICPSLLWEEIANVLREQGLKVSTSDDGNEEVQLRY